MSKIDIPIKVNITRASDCPGDDIVFGDVYVGSDGELTLDVLVPEKLLGVDFDGGMDVVE